MQSYRDRIELFFFFFFIEPLLLRRYLHAVRNDMERAKKLLELSFTMRNQHPEIFSNRDPLDRSTKLILDIT